MTCLPDILCGAARTRHTDGEKRSSTTNASFNDVFRGGVSSVSSTTTITTTTPSPPHASARDATQPLPPLATSRPCHAVAATLTCPSLTSTAAQWDARAHDPSHVESGGEKAFVVTAAALALTTTTTTTTTTTATRTVQHPIDSSSTSQDIGVTAVTTLPSTASLKSAPTLRPRLEDFTEKLWQLWRRYIPWQLHDLEAVRGPLELAALTEHYTPTTRDGRLAALLLMRTTAAGGGAWFGPSKRSKWNPTRLLQQLRGTCAGSSPAESEVWDGPSDWVAFLVSRLLPTHGHPANNPSTARSQSCEDLPSSPVWQLPVYTSALSPRAEARARVPSAQSFISAISPSARACASVVASISPSPSLHESEHLSGASLVFLQMHYHAELESCLSFACHLLEAVTWMRCHPAPLTDTDPAARDEEEERKVATFVCPCGCVSKGTVMDAWCWGFHSHYYRAHHRFTDAGTIALPPPPPQSPADADRVTSLSMLPFMAAQLLAQVVLSVTVVCASEAQQRRQARREARRARAASRAANAAEAARVTAETVAEAGLHLRHDAFRCFFAADKQPLLVAACVLIAWKQLDINAHSHFFFFDAAARCRIRRQRCTAHTRMSARTGRVPLFATDAFAAFRLRSDFHSEQLAEMEKYVLHKVAGGSVAFGCAPLWVSLAMEVTCAFHENTLERAARAQEADLDKYSVSCDGHTRGNVFAERASWHACRREVLKVQCHEAIEHVMQVAIRWLLVPGALAVPVDASPVEGGGTSTQEAQLRRRVYRQLTMCHPLLPVALAVHARAVPRDWAEALVAPTCCPARRASADDSQPSACAEARAVDRQTCRQLDDLLCLVKALMPINTDVVG